MFFQEFLVISNPKMAPWIKTSEKRCAVSEPQALFDHYVGSLEFCERLFVAAVPVVGQPRGKFVDGESGHASLSRCDNLQFLVSSLKDRIVAKSGSAILASTWVLTMHG